MRRNFRRIPRAIKDELEEGLEQSAEELTGMQKRLVPVDRGDLRDSVGWVRGVFRNAAGAIGRSMRGESDKDNFAVTVFSTDFKAPFVEFGTAGSNGKGATPARPFFFPAYRALKRRIKSRLSRRMGKGIRKVVGNGSGRSGRGR